MGFTNTTAIAAPACLLTGVAGSATCAQYPQRLNRAMAPYITGTSHDTIMFIVGEELRESVKQPLIVENRPGVGEKALRP